MKYDVLPSRLVDGHGKSLSFKVKPGGMVTGNSEDGIVSAQWELDRNSLRYEDGSKLSWIDYLLTWEAHAALIPFREYTEPEYVLTVTEDGYGLLVHGLEYKAGGRSGGSQINMLRPNAVQTLVVGRHDQLMLVGDKSSMIRLHIGALRVSHRNMQGQKLMALKPGEKIVSAEVIAAEYD